MKRLSGVTLLLLLSAALLMAQTNGQEGQAAQRPSNDPRINSEVTGTVGTTTGQPASPTFAGDQSRNVHPNSGVGDTQAAQGTRQPRAKGTGSDDGTIRDSNIVAKMHGKKANAAKPKKGTTSHQPKR
jgi:hypothetical protein